MGDEDVLVLVVALRRLRRSLLWHDNRDSIAYQCTEINLAPVDSPGLRAQLPSA